MMEFLAAHSGTVVVAVIIAAVVALIVVNMVRDRKKGKSSCGCGCSNCPSAGMCRKK
ncbi:MAG: FeoB-associated Cys-rich membrane protein [Firmicutes bacterium]|nr:FeoB-associated Cys-rich membrane protein [Bacillota bacterium]